MKSPEEIEKLIVGTRVKARSKMRDKVLPDALRIQEELSAQNKAGTSVRNIEINHEE